MADASTSGFTLSNDNQKLTAWGVDLESAFESALAGLLQVAGAPAGNAPGGKSITVKATGLSPAELLDNLVVALLDERTMDQPLDGSITMGGIVRSDTGWNGWLTAGINPEDPPRLDPFEFARPPMVERKIGRVMVKAQLMVWDPKMLAAMDDLRERFPPEPVIHPGGVVGPESFKAGTP